MGSGPVGLAPNDGEHPIESLEEGVPYAFVAQRDKRDARVLRDPVGPDRYSRDRIQARE
jgi:hypothetical protein